KLFSNLSEAEIKDLLNRQATFTDYNILKEEYIEIHPARSGTKIETKPVFTEETREIEGEQQEYLIISNHFTYGGKFYRLEIGETMGAMKQIEKTILFSTLLILFVSIGLSIIADLAFTKFLLAPFYRIIDQKLNKVDDPIHFNYSPSKTTTEDFKLLDSSISSLMKKISDQILTEKQFITNVSHELLTPISILRARLENILNDQNLSEESLNKIANSLKTLNRLKAIINSLLLISKIENNQFNKNDTVPVQALINDIYEELEDRLTSKNITFENALKYNFEFKGNHALIHTLCMNLINNAIKYNKENGKIVISDLLTKAEYSLFINDEGEGMNPEEIEKAFTRFEKLKVADDDESYGLGLSIVKSISAFHRIGVSISSQKGQGTTVTLTFKNL
ncbi:MAG TPA: sensor histidine kinase, partial [Sphingobacteriaceae bacterium]|nr:sensor histidine kinase [Sphingobacteriaceae bacterium]